MSEVSDRMADSLRKTGGNPNAVDGTNAAWVPQIVGGSNPSIRLPDLPEKPSECKCETAASVTFAPQFELSGDSGQLDEFYNAMNKSLSEPDPLPDTLPNCLHEADRLTSTDRNEAYGHPLDDFECIAAQQTALAKRNGILKEGAVISPELSQQFMVCVKQSREAGHHKPDNLTDGAGYFRTIEMTIQERERRSAAQ